MPKRYRNTEIWDVKEFRELEPQYKLFWIFIKDRCNHGGIWHVDFGAVFFYTGCKLTAEDVLVVFKNKIRVVNENIWHIPEYIEEQYGSKLLDDSVRYQKSALDILRIYNLHDDYIFGRDLPYT